MVDGRGDDETRRHGAYRRVPNSPCLRVGLGLLLLSALCPLPSAFCSSWTRQPSGTMAWLHAVYFLDQNRGWIAGGNGTLLNTVDGGINWNRTVFTPRDTFTDVYFSNEAEGWLLAQRDQFKLKATERPSYLLTTKDGGATWQRIVPASAEVNTRFTR